MKSLLSTGYTNPAFNIALFILRVGSAILMIHHGYDKLVKFADYAPHFTHFLGMNGTVSLALVVFAEFFCALLLMLGLFSRFACIPLLIDTAVAVGKGHKWDILGDGEHASLFFLIFLTILFIGPGKISVDGMIKK